MGIRRGARGHIMRRSSQNADPDGNGFCLVVAVGLGLLFVMFLIACAH